MSKSLLKISLGLLAVAGLVWPVGVMAGEKVLHGHVPKMVSKMTSLGRLDATNQLHLAIGLPLRNQDGIDALLEQIYDPSSPNYHHFLTSDQFVSQFGPTEGDYQAVVNFAKISGLKVVGTYSNRTLVDVVGQVADIEKTFHVKLSKYQHPKESRQFYAPDTEPTVDASLPVLSVCGLNDYVLARPLYKRGKNLSSTNSLSGNALATGSGPQGSYWGYDFRNAYAPGVTLTGTGQKVALFECDGYFASDISTYLSMSGLPSVALTNILIDGATGIPSGTGGEVEVALDIQMANAMAPGLAQIIVYEAPDDTPAYNLDQLNRIAMDNLARQISSSWLIDDTAQFAQIYTQFALQGQSFFQASGDSGAYYPGIFQFEDSPLVTLVGGTTLTSTGSGGVWATEQVWNNGFDPSVGHEWAGGGGVSLVYPIPSWQTWINMTTNKGSTTMRNIPDVALTADNIFQIADGFPIDDEGGTSCAAPLWAGFMSLVNQQLAATGKAPIGFINPTIYSLAQGGNHTNIFHDIVTGNNTSPFSPNLYYAQPGYDLCTGLGTPNGQNLINALTGNVVVNPIIPAPLQPWGNTLSVMDGSNPNGFWFLFVQDDTKNNAGGMINNGWAVNLTTANPVGYAADNELYVNTTVNGQSYGNATNIPAAPGASWISTLAVTNYGPSLATNVMVVDTLPVAPDVILVSATPTVGSVSSYTGALVWSLGNLAVNASATLTLNFAVSNNITGIYTNSATVSATTPDPNPDDASALVIATVPSTPPSLVPSLVPGGKGEFHLSVSNNVGSTYIIEASTNMVAWLPLYTNVSPFIFTNFDVTNFPERFYRAEP